MNLFIIIILILIFLQPSKRTLEGKILGAQQIEWSQVRIKIYHNNEFISYTDSDTSGNYQINELDNGLYHLFFIDPTLSDSIYYNDTLINISNDITHLNIFLSKRIIANNNTPLKYLPYEKDIANYDIKTHNVTLIQNGLPLESEEYCYRKFDSLESEYGFHTIGFGDVIDSYIKKMTDSYNDPVMAYLIKRNGKDWIGKYTSAIDSLNKSIKKLTVLNLDEFEANLYKKYGLKKGKVYINVTVSNNGEMVKFKIMKSNNEELEKLITKEIQQLKFSSFDCMNELSIIILVQIK